MSNILYTLVIIFAAGGNPHVKRENLTADECYNLGRSILKQEEKTGAEYIALECVPEGQPT